MQKANLTLQSKPKSVNTTEYKYIPTWRGQVLSAAEEISAEVLTESKYDTILYKPKSVNTTEPEFVNV